MFKGKVRGFDEIRRNLDRIADAARADVVQRALRKAAEPAAAAARSFCPRGGEAGGAIQGPLLDQAGKDSVRKASWNESDGASWRALNEDHGRIAFSRLRADTGDGGRHLADAIRVYDRKPEEDLVKVTVGYPKRFFYGHFLEWGTVKMVRRPFLRPAWDAHKTDFLRVFSQELWKSIQRSLKGQGAGKGA